MPFNPSQLATWGEAAVLAHRLKTVGGGVKPQVGNRKLSGTYIPDFSGPFPAPVNGKSFFLHFRFNNGAEGVNVGLVREQFKRYPNAPDYVIRALAAEVEALAKS